MRAILFNRWLHPKLSASNNGERRMLPPLLDRPFLQHVVESLVDLEVLELEVVLQSDSFGVCELLGDGTQWGIAIRYVQAQATSCPYGVLRKIDIPDADEPILLAHSDLLPELVRDKSWTGGNALLFCWNAHEPKWTGWGVLSGSDLRRVTDASNEEELMLLLQLIRDERLDVVMVDKPLSIRSYSDLIDSHRRLLEKHHSGLVLTGRETAPGIRISRNVSVHRTATLRPPVFLSENCRIRPGVHLGPGVSIGKDCLIDSNTTIADSVICSGTYVGKGLELRDMYLDGNHLVNTRLLAEVRNVDDVILSSIYRFQAGTWLERAFARRKTQSVTWNS